MNFDCAKLLFKIAGIALVSFVFSASSYTPAQTNRTNVFFNAGWKYKQGDASGADAKTFSDGSWTSVCLPHNTKWITAEDKGAYIGICWYRKHFTVDSSYSGRKAFIEFEAAMQYAEVWVNGKLKGSHGGGYSPFTFDISPDLVYGGGDNVVAVKLNSAGDDRWAPGSAAWIDFQYLGGLYRDVNLYFTDKLHVTDAVFASKVGGGGVFVTYPSVAINSAVVSIKTNIINEYTASKNCVVVSDIVDALGIVAQTSSSTATIAANTDTTFSQSITIQNPKLWHPNTPNLYTVHTTVSQGTTPVDYYKTRIGIRSIAWTHSSGITINGQSYKAQGADMHQDVFGLGNAMPKRAIYFDVKRFKEAGLNFLRGSHYLHNTAFYDACDEFGILVENAMTGWQNYYNTDAFNTSTYQEVKDMIRRDRNHPCVAIWETQLNETPYPSAWATTINTYAHQEFPGSTMYTCGTGADGTWGSPSSVANPIWDVLIGASQHSIRGAITSKPIIIDEYGSWDFGAEASTSDVPRQSADAPHLVQCDNIQKSLNSNRALSWYSADAYWVYGDYAGFIDGGYPVNRLNGCGIVDYYRIPKHSYYFFQSQRDPNVILSGVNSGPMVHIANRWTSTSPANVRVFSNCDHVSLYRDNILVSTKTPDTDTNTKWLLHPPFTFALASFSPGMLRAVGTIAGLEKAWDTVRTPGAAAAVRLRTESFLPLDPGGSDGRLVWIDIVDANKTVVPTSTAQVTLKVTGAAIAGPTTLTMKGGQLATWIRSGTVDGGFALTAQSAGLADGLLTVDKYSTAVQPSIPVKNQSAGSKNVIFSGIGNTIVLPAGLSGKTKNITFYDISGKLLQRIQTQKQVLDVQKIAVPQLGVRVIKVDAK